MTCCRFVLIFMDLCKELFKNIREQNENYLC